MQSKTALALLAAVACPLVLGCSSSGTAGGTPVATTSAALRRTQSCEDLTLTLREDARSKLNRRIDAEVRAIREGYPNYYYGPGTTNAGNLAIPSRADDGATAGNPQAPTGDTASAAPAHSETETQVKGVDEADIVKADGTKLYVLHGQKFLIVDAWPAAKLALAGGLEIEGTPLEMFVANGRAVVFSRADGAPLYAATGITARASYSDAYATPLYGGVADFAPGNSIGGSSQSSLTKVTVLALDGSSASVLRELYFEGDYLSSRRVASKVRVVLEGGAHGPTLDYNPVFPTQTSTTGQYQPPSQADQVAAWEALRSKNQAAIDRTSFSDWVPLSFAKDPSGVHAGSMDCGDFYVPTVGSTEFGMTQIQALDLDVPTEPPHAVAIVGAAQTVYGNATSMLLAGRAYTDPWLIRQSYGYSTITTDSNGTSPPPIPVETLNYTHLHLFDVASDAFQPLYVASGTVPGDVKDQFSLDEKQGLVRVTTTEQRSGPPLADGRQNEVSHVFVLKNGTQGLALFGDAGPIAPGEQLYSTRYVGDKAYVVTWHVTDPLFVIELADPAHPKILGELKIPGFSEYMHPLDDTHLLTIGRETDDTGHQHTDGGYWYGLSIQVFDVTDPLKPALAHKFVYDGGDYATSEATQNHKAFTYFDDRKLLAFPYVRQAGFGESANSGPSSTLEVFHVDVESGIQKLGSVDHSSLLGTMPNGSYGYCGGYFDGSVRRGVFFENVVYSISYGGILASDVAALGTPMNSLKLEAPTMQGLSCSGTPSPAF
ncbi:MAG: beta-propeller domain-containing protein [Pseudomonadota bacterium]